ncbi:MAG: PQQ-binding-like beta-propeller repeat protein [Candidatus Eremiobacteraeota bacterium]|nr:PQQ-binding-like beta-propeller repeat protein [Candidatus Eremiobacteraeota bacterium]
MEISFDRTAQGPAQRATTAAPANGLSGGSLPTDQAKDTWSGSATPQNTAPRTMKNISTASASEALFKGEEQAVKVPSEVMWSFQAPAASNAPPVTGPPGNVYVRAGSDFLYAVDTKGAVLWSTKVEDTFGREPAIDSKGNVYFSDSSFGTMKIASHDPQGGKRWEYTQQVTGTGSKTEEDDRILLDAPSNTMILCLKNRLFGLDMSSGACNWTFSLSDYEYGEVGHLRQGPGGSYYLASNVDHQIHILDPKTGKETGKFKGTQDPHSYLGMAVGQDGTVFTTEELGDWNKRAVRAQKPDGSTLWQSRSAEYVRDPLVGPDGTVYIQRKEGREKYCLDALEPATGELKWYRPMPGGNCDDPLLMADGSLLIKADEPADPATKRPWKKGWHRAMEEDPVSKIYCLSPGGTVKWTLEPGLWLHSKLTLDESKGILYGSDNTGGCLGINISKLDETVMKIREQSVPDDGSPLKIVLEEDCVDIGGIRLPVGRG